MKRFARAFLALAAAIGIGDVAIAGTLDTVKARGVLNCGANGQLPGFGLPDAQGNWTGFDVDYCRAIAATIFNDATGANYYDGQGFIVRKVLKVNSALELGDASICVQQGTTTELNLADYFRANRMKLKTVTFATLDETLKAYETNRCDAFTTDASGLYS